MKSKIIPLFLILLGVAFLLGAITSWFDNLTASQPVGLGKWIFDILVALLGAGAGIKGWLDWNKKDTSIQVTTNIRLEKGQFATGEQAKNFQIKDSGQYIEHYHEALDIESFKLRSLHQLPQPLADFTGRDALIAQLLEDFNSHKGAKMSALTGMGGIGKTALGLEVAHQVAENYPEGQIFLDLKGTTTPLSAVEIARHVILSFEPTADLQALDEVNLVAAYQSVLHGKRVLLFFDNARTAEQIVSLRPPESCAIFVTSRWTFALPGLQIRHVPVMNEDDSTEFLIELCPRTGIKAPELARACGHLPLALRIAGSFLQVNTNWPVEKYLFQLSDRKKRLETLRQSREDVELADESDLLATFELSYSQLSKENQKQWRCLGVFSTSFDSDGAQAMWGLEKDQLSKLLSLLMRYSLLDYDEISSRYSLHDLLVDFALQKLGGGEEEKARILHSKHYQQLLSWANTLYLEGNDGVITGLRLLDKELENIVIGRNWAASSADSNKVALWLTNEYPNSGNSILSLRLYPREHIDWLQDGLQAAYKLNHIPSQGNHLGNLGHTYVNLGEPRKALECYEQALLITRDLRNRKDEGIALGSLGGVYSILGEFHKAIEFYEQELAIAEEFDEYGWLVTIFGKLGTAFSSLGKYRQAIAYYEKAFSIAQKVGDRKNQSSLLSSLGLTYTHLGELHHAIEKLEHALVIIREIGYRRGEGSALGKLGISYASLGEYHKAIEHFDKQLTIAKEYGDRQSEASALGNLGIAYKELKEYKKSIEFYEQQLAIVREIEDRQGEGAALGNLGVVHRWLNEYRKAIEYYEQALSIAQNIGDKRGEEATYGNLGIAYKESGQLHKAIEFYKLQLTVAREIEDRVGESIGLFNLGLALFDLSEKNEAKRLLEQALRISESTGSPVFLSVRNTLKEWETLE